MTAFAQLADEHLVLYDGTCSLCSRVVRFVLRRDRGAVFRFASLQGEPGRAALFVAARLSRPWRWLRVLEVLPTALLDRAYDLVAHHRHRLLRGPEVCALPAAWERKRFLD
jgi:predicted DCC family thiol-disulfide oxidoreductase YuxK